MSNETVSSSIDWINLTSTKVYNETVTINSGATLTVDRSTIDAQGIADAIAGVNITNTAGQSTFKLQNNTTNSLRYYGPESGTLSIQSGASFIVRGGFTILQSSGSDWQSNGNASQSLPAASWTDLYDAACEPAVIFVETGSGTNVWKPWLNLGNLSFSDIGLGELGNWFTFNTTTGVITFGDGGAGTAGHGGNIPVSGARVRVYNIGLGKVTSGGAPGIHATPGTNFETSASGGIIDIEYCYFFGFYFNVSTPASVRLYHVGSILQYNYTNTKRPTMDYVYKSVNRSISAEDSLQSNYMSDAQVNNCIFVANSPTNGPIYALRSNAIIANNTQFITAKRTSANTNSLYNDVCKESIYTDCLFVGGRVNVINSPKVQFIRPKHSDSPHGDAFGSLYNVSFAFTPVASGEGVIDSLTLLSDGAASVYSGAMISNCDTIKNCDYSCDSSQAFSSSFVLYAHNNNWGNPTSSFFGGANTSVSNVIQNQRVTTIRQVFTTNNVPSNSIIKACYCTKSTIPTALSGTINTIFYDILDTDSTTDLGCIGLLFVPKSLTSSAYTTSGAVVFDNGGNIYLKSAGASITYTWPHKLIGVLSFYSLGGLTLAGSGTGNFTVEVSVDGGSWINAASAWSTLAAVSWTASVGPLVKIRITHSSGSSSDYLNKLQLDTTCDYVNYKYPESYATITLQNVKDSSRWMLYNVTDSTVIASGEQSGTSDITVANVPSTGTSKTLKLTVRKSSSAPYYKPFETNAIFTGNNLSIYVSQELDTVAGS